MSTTKTLAALLLVYGSVIQIAAAAEVSSGPVQLVGEQRISAFATRTAQPITDSLARIARDQAPLMTADDDPEEPSGPWSCGKRLGVGAGIGAGIGSGLMIALMMATGGSDAAPQYIRNGGLAGASIGGLFGLASCKAPSASARH